MKTLKKISINPEKVIKNEELVNLKGGYMGNFKCCWNNDLSNCSSCEYTSSSAQCAPNATLVKC